MADGWSELGAMLGGSGQMRQRAYQAGVDSGSRQANLLELARQRRDENVGLEAITPGAISAAQNDPEAAAELVSALIHAKRDPRQFSGYQKDQQGIGFRNDAMAAATDPSVPLDSLNRRLMVIGGKPVTLSKVEGNVALNPMVSPDAQTMAPTEIGLADMMLKGAQAGAAHASAARQRAGIGADKAANYEIVDTGHGLVRVNKLNPAGAVPVTMGNGQPVQKASSGGGQVVQNPDGTTTFIPGGNVNSQERNAAGFYQRMVSADNELAALTDAGYKPTNLRDQMTVGGLTNGLASSQGQQYHQAAQNWVRANLRKESGAAIGEAEMAQEIENYFPRIGDSAGVVAQKARNRKVVEDAMRMAAGRALPTGPASLGEAIGVQPAAAPVPAAPAPQTFRAVNPQTGHAVVWNGSAWVDE